MPSDALRRLVDAIELRDIGPYELHAVRGGLGADGARLIIGPSAGEPLASPEGFPEPTVDLQTVLGETGLTLLIRLRVGFSSDLGELSVGVQAEYEISDAYEGNLDSALQLEFAEQIGVMAIVPYLRHWCAELTRSVFDAPLLLGILKQGQLRFSSEA